MYSLLFHDAALVPATGTGPIAGELLACEGTSAYRPRRPQASSLYRLLDQLFDEVKLLWEERFESRYGPWRGFLDEAVARYLDCGVFERGLARAYCDTCRHDFVISFSCKGRGLCPSCAAKRGAKLAAFLEQEVLEPVQHVQWVFTTPKMLRPYFLHHRELIGELCRAAYETIRELMSAAAATMLRPGFVAVVQTFNSDLRFHPHIHGIASAGGWDAEGKWIPLPAIDSRSAELLFRHKVLALLRDRGLLDDDRIALLLSWTDHTGFSVDNSVVVDASDTAGLARLARYLMRSPVSLERLRWDDATGSILYRPKHGHDDHDLEVAAPIEERWEPLEFIARLLLHVAEPRRHMVRYYGAYAAVVRARRRHDLEAANPTSPAPEAAHAPEHDTPCRQELRRRWADLIRRVYEIDPLICPRCGARMRIIAFITDLDEIHKILAHLHRTGRDPRAPP
jgi:hypothetical protein